MSQLERTYRGGLPCLPKPTFAFRLFLIVAAAGIAVLFSACEKSDSSIIDSTGTPPYVVTAQISPTRVNVDTIPQSQTTVPIDVQAEVTHATGGSAIAQVLCTITDSTGNLTLATGQLFDNGVSPDTQEGDNLFSARLNVPTQDLTVGKYTCQIVATSQQGYVSGTILLPLSVSRQNDRPPVLSDLQAPDSIVLAGQTHQFKLMVKATDPDGQSDIARVFFNSYKPDGNPASGNPFQMFDDGSENIIYPPDTPSGDLVKGDSVYTLGVVVNPSNATGLYRFEFQAVDRSNQYSQKIIWYIQVLP